MRKILLLILLILALVVLWLWRGRDLSILLDRFGTVQTASNPIDAIAYNGDGSGGTLQIADRNLSLDEARLSAGRPNIGTTNDAQLALSYAGKVFPFGPISLETQQLRTNRPGDDTATLSISHSAVPWPNFFEINYMTGNSPKWKRNIYQKLVWKKSNGAKLEMVWRYEQFFYQNNGWTEGLMIRPPATGLIRVEISEPTR